jgi:cystathionine beta-lyase
MSHASASAQEQETGSITENLLRFSVGIEDAVDLIADLTQALAQTRVKTPN